MALLVEIGAGSRRLSIVFKYGHPDATTTSRRISLLAAPKHIVNLLALCQCWTIVTALVHKVGIWLIYGALLVAVICHLGRTISIGERGPLASLFVIFRRTFLKDNLPAPKLALQKVGDRWTKFLESLLLAVDAENTAEAYHRQLQSPLLSLPGEVRMIVYRKLLHLDDPGRHIFFQAARVNTRRFSLLQRHSRSDSTDSHVHIPANAMILRTCRRVYHEALPVLYGENRYSFDDIDDLRTFQTAGLAMTHVGNNTTSIPVFGLEPNSQGRCSLIRHLSILFPGDDMALRAGSLSSRRHDHQEKGSWSAFIHQSRFTPDHAPICFTALRSLQLDFSRLYISGPDVQYKLSVRPFVERFKTPQGLAELTVLGVDDEDTLAALKTGLLRKGGIFITKKSRWV